MDERTHANTTALPIDDRPEVHQPGPEVGRSGISLQQDKQLRDGRLQADRFDDERMRDLPSEPGR